jgi:hypothetical protein
VRGTASKTVKSAVTTVGPDGAHVASAKPSKWPPNGMRGGLVEQLDRSYHVSNGMKTAGVVSTVAAIGVFAREHGPGCYTVDQRYPDPFRGIGVISRAWGKVIHHADGHVTIHIEPADGSGRT